MTRVCVDAALAQFGRILDQVWSGAMSDDDISRAVHDALKAPSPYAITSTTRPRPDVMVTPSAACQPSTSMAPPKRAVVCGKSFSSRTSTMGATAVFC